MSLAWLYQIDSGATSLLLALTMVCAALIGARLGRRRNDTGPHGLGAVETGLFGLLGLLLAFTFSGAASRYDARSQLMVDTANALRTVVMRADLYPSPVRDAIRVDLREFLTAQSSFYRSEHDAQARAAAVTASDKAQQRLWAKIVAASADPGNGFASTQMVNNSERLFALTASRHVASSAHMPEAIVLLLFVLAVATAYTSGYAAGAAGSFSLPGYIAFSVLTGLVVYVTLDLDRPGQGVIRRDVQEQAIESVGALLRPLPP
jgi:hypothetical protein